MKITSKALFFILIFCTHMQAMEKSNSDTQSELTDLALRIANVNEELKKIDRNLPEIVSNTNEHNNTTILVTLHTIFTRKSSLNGTYRQNPEFEEKQKNGDLTKIVHEEYNPAYIKYGGGLFFALVFGTAGYTVAQCAPKEYRPLIVGTSAAIGFGCNHFEKQHISFLIEKEKPRNHFPKHVKVYAGYVGVAFTAATLGYGIQKITEPTVYVVK